VEDLVIDWGELGHEVRWAHQIEESPGADFCFCLSFGRLVPSATRALFGHTLVVHESDLPHGKGWSPLTWQILEGRARIPVTLFEAAANIDSGAIYAQRWIEFQGHELVDELRAAQAAATLDLCHWFVEHYPASVAQARPQTGAESLYPRRGPDDSRLDPCRTIAEQFDLLRVVDNRRYPAFFEWRGRRYRIAISHHANESRSHRV
jgi:methionyl-tRNA formyltransferase